MPLDLEGLTFPELVELAGQLCDTITDQVAAASNVFAGPADGGPDGDGYYDFPVVGTPGTVKLPSFARIMAEVVTGGPLFTELSTYRLPPLRTSIQTSGYDRRGWGGATYVVTSNTGETAYRTQLASGQWVELTGLIPHLGCFGGHPAVTNNDTAIAAAFAWAGAVVDPLGIGATGRTVLVLDGIYRYATVRDMPARLTLTGAGWGAVMKGPGLRFLGAARDGAGWVTYAAMAITVRDLTLDGTDHTATGRGLDFLGGNFAHVEHVNFVGYRDQLVFDVVQRGNYWRCEFNGKAGTKKGVWIPRGTEAHASVSLTLHPSNIINGNANHWGFVFADSDAVGIMDNGGLQHTVRDNQFSGGWAFIRMAGVGNLTVSGNDIEFSSTWSIVTATTTSTGEVVGDSNILNIESGNYIDKPMSVPNLKALLNTGNDYFIPGQAAIQGCASIRSIWSVRNKNNRTGGKVLDGVPTVAGGSIFQFDEENFLPVVNISPASFTPGFGLKDTVGSVIAELVFPAAAGRLEGKRDGVTNLMVSFLDGYIRFGNRTGNGPRVYGTQAAPDGTNTAGSPPGDSVAIRRLGGSEAYLGQSLWWVKDNGGSWWEMGRPRTFTLTEALALNVVKNVTIYISDYGNRPAYGDGDGAPGGSAKWRWTHNGAEISIKPSMTLAEALAITSPPVSVAVFIDGKPAYGDGTNWRWTTDNTVVS